MQQSPPSPHPINQYCGDIIVKQARSLRFAPTRRGEEITNEDLDSATKPVPPFLLVNVNVLAPLLFAYCQPYGG